MKLDEKTIGRCIEEFDTCIECEQKFFHKRFCTHGIGLDGEELVRRLKKRAMELKPTAPTLICCRCGETAIGTGWIAYHDNVAILYASPLCSSHAYFEDDRPHGFIPDLITKNTFTVQKYLANLD